MLHGKALVVINLIHDNMQAHNLPASINAEEPDIRFEPSNGAANTQLSRTADQLPSFYKKYFIEGAKVSFKEYDFGVIFSQRLTVMNFVFWLHRLQVNRDIHLNLVSSELMITLNYMMTGSVRFMNGEKPASISESSYQLYGLATDTIYSIDLLAGNYICFHFAIPNDMVPSMIGLFDNLGSLRSFQEKDFKGLCYPHTFIITPSIYKKIDRILSQQQAKDPTHQSLRNLKWHVQLQDLLNDYFEDNERFVHAEGWNDTDLKLADLCAYILEHLSDDMDINKKVLNLSTIAKQLKTNSWRLRNLIRAAYNMNLKELIYKMRMERAARMIIEHPGKRISDIGYMLGYTTPAHFSRAFRDFFRKTPLEFRMDHERKGPDEG